VDEQEVVSRVAGRVIDDFGHSYHIPNNPPPAALAVHKREDDEPEIVRKRFREYMKDIKPIAARYRKKGLLISVDAGGTIGTVLDQLLDKLGKATNGSTAL
jgi:adenylate kinase